MNMEQEQTQNNGLAEKHHPNDQVHQTSADVTPPSTGKAEDIEKQSSSSRGNDAVNEEREHEDLDLDSSVVTFDGSDDQENPYNWSKSKKWTIGGVLSAMAFVT